MWFILIKFFKCHHIIHDISGVEPFSIDYIQLYSFCFLPLPISLLNLHNQLYLFLIFNLDDLFNIPFSYCFHICCKPAGSRQDFFNYEEG